MFYIAICSHSIFLTFALYHYSYCYCHFSGALIYMCNEISALYLPVTLTHSQILKLSFTGKLFSLRLTSILIRKLTVSLIYYDGQIDLYIIKQSLNKLKRKTMI